MVPEPGSVVQVHNEAICQRNNEVGSKGRVGGKKCPFDLIQCVDSVPNDSRTLDKISKYSMLQMDCSHNMPETFLRDDFSVMRI